MAPLIYVALDVGTVRIGIAVSNPDTGIAIPYSTVHLTQFQDPCQEIADLLKTLGAHVVVVGWPLELDGSSGPAIRRTRAFIANLKKRAPHLKFVKQDERLTSSQAENTLQTLHVMGSDKKNIVDAMAAAIILQTYLDTHLNKI